MQVKGYIAAAGALTALLAGAAYADEPAQRVLLTHANDIDGPIAHTAMSFARDMWPDVEFVVVQTTSILTPRQSEQGYSCIIGVGQHAEDHAQAWWYQHYEQDPQIELAVGGDRYETAWAVADAVERCVAQ